MSMLFPTFQPSSKGATQQLLQLSNIWIRPSKYLERLWQEVVQETFSHKWGRKAGEKDEEKFSQVKQITKAFSDAILAHLIE